MDYINLLGLLAGTLTTFSFVPQVIRTWKTKSAKDVSLAMLLILAAGVFLWIIYGVRMRALPIILANSATLVLILLVLFLKYKYK
ncbi:MAG: SemiSWEET family sugar transporter [Endomicrobiales bacterium]